MGINSNAYAYEQAQSYERRQIEVLDGKQAKVREDEMCIRDSHKAGGCFFICGSGGLALVPVNQDRGLNHQE